MSDLSLLIDGYISWSFSPRNAEQYLQSLLKTNVIPSHPASHFPGKESAFFVVHSVPRHISLQFPNQSSWVLDRSVMARGTVVPQTLGALNVVAERGQHVAEDLQLPIFFESMDGRLGLPLEAAVAGRTHDLLNAQAFAPLGLMSTTQIRIHWPGYVEFKRQVQTRNEVGQRNLISISRFAHHVGLSVDAFLKNCQPDSGYQDQRRMQRWRIGEGGIQRGDIMVIGAIHVSTGNWMPILQLSRYIL
ncbi:hypothetical protein BC826DRAFT_105032 [Russula brevipes]|nr:hypothetical protein BC826DRAFT_105032 [Russula brevipes]